MTPVAPAFDIALLWLIAGWAVLGIGGLVLLWALFRDRSRGRRRCPKCWYDMSGVPGLRCPECGREAKSERQLLKTRRRWRWAALASLLFCAGLVGTYAPTVKERGVLAVLPRPVIRVGLWWERERAKGVYEQQLAAVKRSFGGSPTRLRTSKRESLLIAMEAGRILDSANFKSGVEQEASWALSMCADLGPEFWPAADSVVRAMAPPIDEHVLRIIGFHSLTDHDVIYQELERQALTADSPDDRLVAVEVLATTVLKRPETLERFQRVFFKGTDPRAAAEFMHLTLKAHPTSPGVQDLLIVSARHPDPEFRRVAGVTFASNVAWYGAYDDFAMLLLADPAPSVRAAGVQALVRVNGLRQVWGMAVVRACEDENLEMRRAGLSILREWRHRTDWSDGLLREWLALRDIEAIPPIGRRVMAQWEEERLGVSLGDAEESP